MLTNWMCLTHVKCATLAVQSPHYVASADGLAAAQFHDSANVLSKCKKVESVNGREIVFGAAFDTHDHDLLEEALEFGAYVSVDCRRDALDAATTRETADFGLADALDVVFQDLPMSSLARCYAVELLGSISQPLPLRARVSHAETFASDSAPTYASDRRLAASGFSAGSLSSSRTAKRHVVCVLRFVCFGVDMLWYFLCIGWILDQKPAEERGTFDDMDWQIDATVATVTSLATVKGAIERLAESSHLR